MDNPFEGEDWEQFVDQVNTELIPKIDASAITISLCPGEKGTDVKFAVELGFSIMMDKPIIGIVPPGTLVPRKLRDVADILIIGKPDDPETMEKLKKAMTRIAKKAWK